jgi:hypothetical protein
MDWADYLRDEAAKFRQLAETAEDPSIKQELLDLAAVCEEVANNIEDRMPGGRGRRDGYVQPHPIRYDRLLSWAAVLR